MWMVAGWRPVERSMRPDRPVQSPPTPMPTVGFPEMIGGPIEVGQINPAHAFEAV